MYEIEDEEGAIVRMGLYDSATGETMTLGVNASALHCYSTREAARAARRKHGHS